VWITGDSLADRRMPWVRGPWRGAASGLPACREAPVGFMWRISDLT